MKESDAKEKWCPLTVFANYTTERNEIGERYPEGTKAVISSRCIGSACMMWKPREIDPTYSTLGDEPEGDCGLKR